MGASRQSKVAIMNSVENSLVALLREKPFNDIFICELCERAGVGRSSFYRYYASKEDVMISLLLREWYAWRHQEGSNDYNVISHESACSFIRHCYALRDLFDLIYSNELDRLFPTIIKKNAEGSEGGKNYKISFFCYGVFGILRDWWERGCEESPEYLIKILEEVCPSVED